MISLLNCSIIKFLWINSTVLDATTVVPTKSPVILVVVCPMSIIGHIAANIGTSVNGIFNVCNNIVDITIPAPLTPAVPTDNINPKNINWTINGNVIGIS